MYTDPLSTFLIQCPLIPRSSDPSFEILDGRPPPRFKGEAPEPRPGLHSGCIPGSKNIFFKDLVDEHWRYKTDEELLKVFEEQGVVWDRDFVTSCGSGLTAAVISLAAHLLGKERTLLYDRSWAEYGKINP